MDETKKHIDETWKEGIVKEKGELKEESEQAAIAPEANFNFFINTLALQCSIFLGLIPNPQTNKKESNLSQAKFIIDTLEMLKDKTKNNLNEDENNLLENVLYELRMQYISVNKKEGAKND